MPITQTMTFDESLIEDLKTMLPGEHYYMSVLKDRESLLNDLNNSESGRKWIFHPSSDIVCCVTPRIYKFMQGSVKWNDGVTIEQIAPFLPVRHGIPMPIDRNPATEQEIQEAGDHQESLILESVYMGEFIASTYGGEES